MQNTSSAALQPQEDLHGHAAYGDYQNEIYFAGLRGVRPKLPVDFKSLEARAGAALPPSVLSYVQGGCGDERTQDLNVAAFRRWGLIPRMMVDASQRDLSVDLFGVKLPTPLFMSPIGVIGLCAQDGRGDIATARAAARIGVPMVASTLSVDPLEAGRQENSAADARFCSSSTRRETSRSPKASSIAPRPPASRPSW